VALIIPWGCSCTWLETLPTLVSAGENDMKKDLNIIDFLAQVPWWAYLAISASFYLLLNYLVPYFEVQNALFNEAQVSLGPAIAPVVALALLAPASFSLLKLNRKNKLHELREEIKSIQELPWQQFKEMVAEAYRRSGYMILETSSFATDPGVDLVMRKSANLYLLQCRYWQNRKLGIREAKKLQALLHEKHATAAFLLTTGIFTKEARHYALSRPINLVDGIELVELLGGSKTIPTINSAYVN
jgi:restriction system protein